MPMVQTLTKNKRSAARKGARRSGPRDNSSDTSPFPEYIEHKDDLYRCLLCKDRTLEKYMWLNRLGMHQHEKRGTRHKQAVRKWLKAKASGVESSTHGSEGDEVSTSDAIETPEEVEELDELADDVEMEEPETESVPVVEDPGIPILYYPTTSWDEPVKQGVRVVFDNSQVLDHESDSREPPSAPEVRKETAKWDGSSQGCVYGSTKTNGYYTCIWCNLPDMPQRKYRRCKRATKALQEKPIQVVENNSELDYEDPPSYQLLYPSY